MSGEHLRRHPDLGHLKRDITPVANDLRGDLDQLLAQAAQGPQLRRLRHRQRPHEIPKIIGQHMKLVTHGVGGEGPI